MHEVVSWSCLYMDQVSCLLRCPCFRKSKQVSLFSNRCYPETEGLHTGFRPPPPQQILCILQCMRLIPPQSEGYGPAREEPPGGVALPTTSPEWPAVAPVLTVSEICEWISEVKAQR